MFKSTIKGLAMVNEWLASLNTKEGSNTAVTDGWRLICSQKLLSVETPQSLPYQFCLPLTIIIFLKG